jgi:hypothetical protein
MAKMAKGISEVIILEYGQSELLARLSDPFWFQAFSCVLGYDWHSSGTTTVTCGALKDALDPQDHGIMIAGGKGRTSKNTPSEIIKGCDELGISSRRSNDLVYSSKMSAKVDNSAILDSYHLYHHVIIFTEQGKWCVIQQGMNPENKFARRYHWISDGFDSYVSNPHSAILGEKNSSRTLDMTSPVSSKVQKISVDLVNDSPKKLKNMVYSLGRDPYQSSLFDWSTGSPHSRKRTNLNMPNNINWNYVRGAYDFQPKNYEELLSIPGIGPRTVRTLALVAEIVYGESPSWSDPVKFSFAVGGKDGIPYPVDRKAYDESIQILSNGIHRAKCGEKDKLRAISRLREFIPPDFDWS